MLYTKSRKEYFMELLMTILVVVLIIAICSIRQINQYERGILFNRGKRGLGQ